MTEPNTTPEPPARTVFRYAQINVETGVCVAVSMLSGEVIADNMIELADVDDVNPLDIYDAATGTWAPAPPLPPPGPTLDDKVATLEAEKAALAEQLAEVNRNFTDFVDYYFTQNPEPL